MNVKAVALLSGGLDSVLAVRVILDQGVEVEALNYVMVFCTCTPKGSSCSAAKTAVKHLGIGLKVINISRELLEVVKNPRHGYGRNLNPCLDCRILMFRKAAQYMREIGASFVITGEVLGERPMSQRREAMQLIEKESGLDGLIVRPLSAAVLKPSIPEKEAWVDRSKLLGITGRSRKPQIELARSYGITDYPCPAGGCLLTDPGFAARMRDLMKHDPGFSLRDVRLLKLGRHFRISSGVKAVVGRDEAENKKLLELGSDGDMLLEAADFKGPLTLVRGGPSEEDLRVAAMLTLRYGKGRGADSASVKISEHAGARQRVVVVPPAPDSLPATLRIGTDSQPGQTPHH